MRVAAVVALIAAGAAAADDRRAVGDGAKPFQGTWTIVEMEVVGEKKKEPRKEPVSAPTVVFDDDKYRIKAGDDVVEEGTFRVDAAKTPNRIEVATTAGPDTGKKWHGIYKLEGDTLRAVVGPTDKDPPTKLVKPDPGSRSFTLKRVKGAKAGGR